MKGNILIGVVIAAFAVVMLSQLYLYSFQAARPPVPAGNSIIIGPAPQGAPFEASSVHLDGLTLRVNVAYSGGCAEHDFRLYASEGFQESQPAQLDVFLVHSDPGDPCDGIENKQLEFDLSPLRDYHFQLYRRHDTFTISVFANDRSQPAFATFSIS